MWRLSAFVLLIAGGAGAGEWIGRTEERFHAPATSGLSRPHFMDGTHAHTVVLDLDRDGDLDAVKISRGSKTGFIHAFCRRSNNRLAQVWRSSLTPQTEGDVTGIFTARITEDRWPELIVEVSAPPYFAYFKGRGDAAFSLSPQWLAGRFPIRYYRPGMRIEPYLSVLGILDWDGDGFDDVLTFVHDAALDGQGTIKANRAGIYVLYGGARWGENAEEVLNLLSLGSTARVLALRDFDGDGTVELLLEIVQLRGTTIRVSELLFLRKDRTVTQESAWTLSESQLVSYTDHDLNGDGIADVVLADPVRNHFLLLLTQRQTGRGFSFTMDRITLPTAAYGGDPDRVSLYFDDCNKDGLLDFSPSPVITTRCTSFFAPPRA